MIYEKVLKKYPVLTKEQEKTASKELLIMSNIRLVIKLAKRYSDYKFEDLVSEGIIGLHRAAELWDYKKSKFATYATWWIRQRMWAFNHHDKTIRPKQKHTVDKIIEHDDLDSICIVKDSFFDFDDFESLEIALDCLDKRDRKMIYMTYFEGKNNSEIGRVFGIGRERIRQLKERAMAQLRESLNAETRVLKGVK